MTLRLTLAAAFMFALAACQPATKALDAPPPAELGADADASINWAAAGELAGTLTQADDAGYPMFAIGITGADNVQRGALLNAEETNIAGGVEALKGKAVIATIEQREEVQPLDIVSGTQSFLMDAGEAKPVATKPPLTFTGKMSGAAAATASDLPSRVTLTAADGKTLGFDWFVTTDFARHNGETVTLTYQMDTASHVTALKAAP